uniref:Fibronectin type-III domain-containing protein n=1 Tax=Tetradesmus obliquus TaxID=3088 RepID=A0A383V726_TETOB|eukprot:jgi/Sobl393_1/14179/SZX60156.1
MGQPYRCLAAWLLVAFTAIALAAPEDANSAAACSDQRPNQPQQLRLKAIPNTSSIGALWEAPGNKACVDNYIVLVRPAAGASKEPSPHKVKSRSVIVSNLRPNTVYRVDVVPVSRKRGTGPFATATVTTLSGPSCNPKAVPGKAQQVKATPSSSRNDRVTVTWAPNSGGGNGCVNGYRVEGFDASNGAMVVSINLGRDVEELNVNGLIPGTKYNFIVIAKSNAAYSPEATVQVTTLGKAPAPPPAPAAAPAPQQQQQQQPAASTPVPAAAAPAQPALVPAFAPAAAPAVTTDSSEQVEFKQPAAAQPATIPTDCRSDVEPAPPQSFTAVPLGKDKMSLSWQNGDPGICTQAYKIDAYQLKTGDRVIGTETGFSSYTLTKLVPGVEYAFTVAAVNSKGDSIPATAMSSTPKNRR